MSVIQAQVWIGNETQSIAKPEPDRCTVNVPRHPSTDKSWIVNSSSHFGSDGDIESRRLARSTSIPSIEQMTRGIAPADHA